MGILKTIWPTPFKIKKGDLISLVIQLVIFILLCFVVSILIGVLSKIAVIGVIFGIIGGLMDIYFVVGIVLCILKFLGIVK